MTVFERVCGVLNESGIAHALIGASALAARGVARSTSNWFRAFDRAPGGPQDLWDVRELLRQPASARLMDEVTGDLAALSSEMRQRWQSLNA